MRATLQSLLLLCLIAILTACSGAAPTATPAADPLVTFTRSGGIQGKTISFHVYEDGRLIYTDANGVEIATQVPESQVQPLKAALSSNDWQTLDAHYGEQVPDGYAYMIESGGKQVQTFDSATQPPILERVLNELHTLIQIASPN